MHKVCFNSHNYLKMNIQEKKIENAILFFTNKSNNCIDRLKLIKLIWLSDRIHLNKYGRLILKDRYKALPNGPIASQTLTMTNYSLPNVYDVENYNIKSKKQFDSNYFSKSDLKVMDYVWNKFKNYDGFYLSNYSHLFPEWLRFENELNNRFLPDAYDIVIQDFFGFPNIEDFSDIIDLESIELSKQEFNINNSIQSILR